jgi:FMN phosphatase YigB (HAD superfamily)
LLIIFDLDDTLIDTSGSITPLKLKEAFSLLTAGRGSLEEWEMLLQINRASSKTKDALAQFAHQQGCAAAQLHEAVASLSSPLPPTLPQVPCTPKAKEVLASLAPLATLALVTGGHPPLQMEKLKKAGLEASFFSKIAIPEDSVKKPFYKACAEEFSAIAQEIWVCGDRIEMDLAPAHELGFRTLHMRWGRGLQVQTPSWVDHAIKDLTQLKSCLNIGT